LLTKILGRRLCSKCGGNFNIADIFEHGYEMPALLPKDPKCNKGENCVEHWKQRADDNVDTITNRMFEYHS